MNDSYDFNDKLKSKLGKGVKAVGRKIALAFLPIIPYLLLFCFAFLLFLFVYFMVINTALSFLNDAAETSAELGQRWGNLVSFHGFKTNYEFEKSEQNRFVKTLQKYKEKYDFDDYQLTLITQTLLFEGSIEESIYLSEVDLSTITSELNSALYNNSTLTQKFEGTSFADEFTKNYFSTFLKVVPSQFVSNFVNSYFGQSQYEKRNKQLYRIATIVDKCQSLTNGNFDKFNTCYKGYLVANDDIKTTYYILNNEISPVNEGYLINRFPFSEIQNNLMDLSYSILSHVPLTRLIHECAENMKFKTEVMLFYDLAKANDNYFFYQGYIVDNLKEYYKVETKEQAELSEKESQNDQNILKSIMTFAEDNILGIAILKHTVDEVTSAFKNLYQYVSIDFTDEELEILKKEIDNREAVADTIILRTKIFYGAKYGDSGLENGTVGKAINAVGNNEQNTSVKVNYDGMDVEVSLNDYILLYATNKYEARLKEALEKGDNQAIENILLISKQNVYRDLKYNGQNGNTLTSNEEFNSDFYKELSGNQKSQLNNILSKYRGLIFRDNNGKIINLSNDQSNLILDKSQNSPILEVVQNVIGSPVTLKSSFQIPVATYSRISEYYGGMRADGPHNAIDFAAAEGTSIYSASDGIVADVVTGCTVGSTGCGGGFGNRVYVAYTNGDGHVYYVIYGHMSRVSNVSVGDTVTAGSLLGYVGNTGYSFGNHLHFEIRVDSTAAGATTVDPQKFFELDI